LIAALIVLAFSFQSYVAQTHIHDAAPITSDSAKSTHHNKSPLGNTPVECPFCQAVAHDGTVFMPMAPVLFLSEQWIEMASPYFMLHGNAVAPVHDWQSRAPPHP
jgi:hypothetical protein